MIAALRESIGIKWKGTYEHVVDGFSIDWIEGMSYKKLGKELIS